MGIVLIVAFCLLMEAFFTGAEMVLVSADRHKLTERSRGGDRGAGLALDLLSKPERALATTLTATNVFVVLSSVVVTSRLLPRFGEYASLVAVLLVTFGLTVLVDLTVAIQVGMVLAAFLFVCGFSTVFVALGASASAIGAVMRSYAQELSIIAGIVIIVMGLHFIGLTRFSILLREHRVPMPRPAGLWGAYVMGLAFAFGWTPCIGPVLAAILAVAAAKETVLKGAGLLALYSAGLGIPFLIAAFAIEPFAAFLARFKRHLGTVEKAMGVLLVLTGIAFLTGWITTASFWLLEWFPALGNIG